jgi:uncharacterized membrane protein YoaK (UPF0700 family)
MKDPTTRGTGTPAKHATIATILAAVAGFVDTAGFLTLAHVYTANMSGNTVQVGVEALGDTGGSPILHAYTVDAAMITLTPEPGNIHSRRRA